MLMYAHIYFICIHTCTHTHTHIHTGSAAKPAPAIKKGFLAAQMEKDKPPPLISEVCHLSYFIHTYVHTYSCKICVPMFMMVLIICMYVCR